MPFARGPQKDLSQIETRLTSLTSNPFLEVGAKQGDVKTVLEILCRFRQRQKKPAVNRGQAHPCRLLSFRCATRAEDVDERASTLERRGSQGLRCRRVPHTTELRAVTKAAAQKTIFVATPVGRGRFGCGNGGSLNCDCKACDRAGD